MKLRSVIAAVAAVAVAATTTVTSFAASAFKGATSTQSGMFACLLSDDPNVPLFTDYAPMSDFTGFTLTVKATDKRAVESAIAEQAWVAGAFGFNSQSTGWKQIEWGLEGSSAGDKDYLLKATDKRGEFVLNYSQDTPIFKSTDTYAQVWIQNYADAYEFEIVSYTLLNSKGEDITKTADEKPADTTKPAETTAPADEPADETVEVVETADVDETVDVTVDETVDVTVDDTAEVATSDETADAADNTNTNTDANKGNPDTGVAGVAVAAGVVALAGAAVVVSRKRK